MKIAFDLDGTLIIESVPFALENPVDKGLWWSRVLAKVEALENKK